MVAWRAPKGLEDKRAMFPVGSRALWAGVGESERVVVVVRAHFARFSRARFPDGSIQEVHPADLRPRSWRAD